MATEAYERGASWRKGALQTDRKVAMTENEAQIVESVPRPFKSSRAQTSGYLPRMEALDDVPRLLTETDGGAARLAAQFLRRPINIFFPCRQLQFLTTKTS